MQCNGPLPQVLFDQLYPNSEVASGDIELGLCPEIMQNFSPSKFWF